MCFGVAGYSAVKPTSLLNLMYLSIFVRVAKNLALYPRFMLSIQHVSIVVHNLRKSLPQGAEMADDAHRSKILKLCRLCGKIASSNTSSFKTVKLIQLPRPGGTTRSSQKTHTIFRKTLSWSLLSHNSILHSKLMQLQFKLHFILIILDL